MAVAKVSEIISSSEKSIEDAVQKGVARADKTLDGIQNVWVQDIKGVVENGQITEWRTTLKVTFILKG